MIVRMKSYYLKKNVEPKELEHYGFRKCGDNYSRASKKLVWDIRYYNDTRRIVHIGLPYKESRARKIKCYISDLIKAGLVELKTNYEWWTIIGKWQNYSQKKIDRIKMKLDKLNKGN